MTPFRRSLAIGLRIVAGGVLVALAAWYGAVSRSPWTILYAAAALSIAMAATKRRYWRAPVDPGRFWLATRLIGTAVSETILAALLFFLAYGIAAAIGTATPFAALTPGDALVAAGALGLSLALFLVIHVLEGGRDPVDLALEDFAAAFDAEDQAEGAPEAPAGTGATDGDRTAPKPESRASDIERVREPDATGGWR